MMEERLQALCPIPLTIAWHENKSSYLSIRKEKGRLFLRLHRLFLTAPTPVLEALVMMSLKKNNPEARATVRKMAHLYFSQNHLPAENLNAQGTVYDLSSIYEEIKRLYFSPDYEASIGWGNRGRKGRFRSITFGSYDRSCRQIRIHPLLDDAAVPRYFVEFIVYHEMLHAVCLPKMDASGRYSIHTAEFRQKERLFPHFAAAKEWEKKSLIFFKRRKLSHGRS